MNPADVAASYDTIAEIWSGEDFDRSNGIAQHGRALAFCRQSSAALDVGCLRPAGGVCIFSMGGVDEEEEKTDAAMGPEMYYSSLGISKTLSIVESCGCVCRHLEYDQYPEAHAYLIVQRL